MEAPDVRCLVSAYVALIQFVLNRSNLLRFFPQNLDQHDKGG